MKNLDALMERASPTPWPKPEKDTDYGPHDTAHYRIPRRAVGLHDPDHALIWIAVNHLAPLVEAVECCVNELSGLGPAGEAEPVARAALAAIDAACGEVEG